MAALWSRSNLVARLVAKNSSGGRAGGGDLLETSSVAGERRLKLRRSLPSCDGDIDISGLVFDAEGDPPDFLGRQNGCPRAGELIEHHLAPRRAIQKRIGDERDRLDRRMGGKRLYPASPEGVDARISPDIGAIAAEPA